MKLSAFLAFGLILVASVLIFAFQSEPVETSAEESMSYCPDYIFGFNNDSVDIHWGEISKNDYLSTLLINQGASYNFAMTLCDKAKDVCPANGIRPGKTYAFIHTDSCELPDYFVYEPNQYRYVVFDLRDSGAVVEVKRPVDTVRRHATGVIRSSLSMTMSQQNIPLATIDRMEDALAWSVDFYHIQNGDRFKVIYDELYIEGERVGVGDLHAAYYETGSQTYYSILYEAENYDGYFDELGRPMRKAFLKSPVKYGRISSRYNLRRFHPVLKRTRPHYGTDYAAAHGSPIRAVADGTVVKVTRSKGAGKFVKLKHDDTYSTAYLHMSKYAKIKPGDRVKQGQTIGYVGQTGYATGPHVCFRFWKNGKLVNHLRENLPPPEPMAKEELPRYFVTRDRLKAELDGIKFEKHENEAISEATEEKVDIPM